MTEEGDVAILQPKGFGGFGQRRSVEEASDFTFPEVVSPSVGTELIDLIVCSIYVDAAFC